MSSSLFCVCLPHGGWLVQGEACQSFAPPVQFPSVEGWHEVTGWFCQVWKHGDNNWVVISTLKPPRPLGTPPRRGILVAAGQFFLIHLYEVAGFGLGAS